MPIGDLLAQISGDGSSSDPAPALSRSNSLPKRKADAGETRNFPAKAPRTTTLSTSIAPRSSESRPRPTQTSTPPPKTGQPSRPLPRSTSSQRPSNGSGSTSSFLSSKPMNGANRVQKPPAGRPSAAPAIASSVPRVTPKKGSFAEILARGQRAQAVMGQVGKIQHKKVQKTGPPPKEENPKVDPRMAKKRQPPQPSGYSGTAKPGQRNGATDSSGTNGKDKRNGKAVPMTKAEKAKAAAQEEREKRVKKAAMATTGYTGTARPAPGATAKKQNTHRGGALLNTPAPRHTSSRDRYDDYDEDMDDFIDYDDEDEGGEPRYGYASDGSSDMEAGLDDIDGEERRAAAIARREDDEEERLERSRKMAKEERKRRALEDLRSNRR